jgi:hypothetical protein
MTRIQGEIERELRGYPDDVFEHTVFPERVLFPLRWMLQNAIRFAAQGEAEHRIVRERVFAVMLGDPSPALPLRDVVDAAYAERQAVAERLAEDLVAAHYPEIMAFYQATLRSFMTANRVPPDCYEWLLDGLVESRNAVVERPPRVDPAAVWAGAEFDIDTERGQVISMRGREGAPHVA